MRYHEELSLSRLNYRLPRCEAHPEGMQGTPECHHQIADALLPQADAVLDDGTALDTSVDRLDPQPTPGQGLGGSVLLPRPLLIAGFLHWHADRDLRERKSQAAQTLHQPAPRRQGQGIRRRGSNGLSMGAAAIGVPEKEEAEQDIDSQDIFDGVVLVLAALTRGLCRRVFGADDAPLGAVIGQRGDAGATVGTVPPGGGSAAASGGTTGAASASETPQRCARAARQPDKRTCSHCGAWRWPLPIGVPGRLGGWTSSGP